MTQVLPASLVAPTRASQSVGYQIRAVDGTTIATAFTTTGVAEVSATGYYRVNGGITAPDDGGTLEWYLNNAGSAGAFLSAVAIEPAPNQADQAAGIRAALGLANPDLDTQLGNIPTTPLLAANYTAPDNAAIAAIQAKTNALPDDPADQSELAQLIAAIPQGLTTQQNTRLTQLWQQAGFDSAVPVVRDKEGDVITETIGTTVITHTATNAGDTVTTERQP
jgi:hypothetical protein